MEAVAIVPGFAGTMSEVISFRLNPDNSRELQALDFLLEQQAQGYSIRHILPDALIESKYKHEQEAFFSIDDFQITLIQLSDLVDRIIKNQGNFDSSQPEYSQQLPLNNNLLRSMKNAMKPGMKLG